MASTIEQIMAELDRTAGYAKDREILQTRLNALPGQAEAEISGLDAKKNVAFDSILQGARGRGVGFSGIPIEEQAKYSATDYMPAIARVKTAQNEQTTGILGTLNSLSRDQRTQAQGMFESQREFDERKRQFDQQMAEQRAARAASERAARIAASAAGAGDFLGGGGGGGPAPGGPAPAAAKSATMTQRKGGGYNFTDAGGRAISAAQYARAKGVQFRDLLGVMAKGGDAGARTLLGFVGNDYGLNAKKAASGPNDTKRINSLYKAFTWGVK